MQIKIGDKFISKNGLVGTVKDFGGVTRLEVRNELNKVIQTISLKKIALTKFEKVEA